MKRIIFAMLFSFIMVNANAAVFKVTKKNFEKIKIGMTTSEVLKIVGRKPDSKSQSEVKDLGKIETWVWYSAGTKLGVKAKGIWVDFLNNKVNDKTWHE